jgi:transcriptional regulator with XRE-family HTH domain
VPHAGERADNETPPTTPPVPVPGPGASFADRLNYLFDRVRPPGADEYSNAHVAREISSYGDENITGAYIGLLRKGQRNPTVKLVPLFARFFGVEAGFFVEDEVTLRVTKQFDLLRQLSQADVKQIALRAIGLSPKSLNEVLKKIEAVREREGLPSDPDQDLP